MVAKSLRCTFLAVALLAAAMPVLAVTSRTIQAHHDRLAQEATPSAVVPFHARMANVHAAYRTLFAPLQVARSVGTMPDADLALVYDATFIAAGATHDLAIVHDLQLDLSELQRRKLAKDPDYTKMYQALVGTRRFGEANVIARRHPSANLARLPQIREAASLSINGATELAFTDDGKTLLRQHAMMGKGAPHVVAILHPLSQPSQEAATAINADPALVAALKGHATWLAPPEGDLHQSTFEEWNRTHPNEVMTLAYRRSEWPSFDSWDTPTFYFFNQGKLVAKVAGWPKDGNTAALVAAMKKIGLLH